MNQLLYLFYILKQHLIVEKHVCSKPQIEKVSQLSLSILNASANRLCRHHLISW